ncbi:unnamed protein product [Lymnaea stagnalis]|uniref:Aminopeptidase NAALADL1 n=1 Tax=Lymnaea stagnalis TaxID=6523 RepID=A0AAV2HBQ5_LYMST
MNADDLLVKRKRGSKRFVIGAAVIGALFFLVGILIGFFSHESELHPSTPTPKPERLDPTQFMIQNVDAQFLRNKLQNFTSQVRMAGTDGAASLAETIQSLWLSSGVENVHIASYEVLISFPNQSEPNKVELVNKTSGRMIFTSNPFEQELRPAERNSTVVSFTAYSPKGLVLGDIVYVNYGRVEDFEFLRNNLSINVHGKIVIARYGKICGGNKVLNAEKFNVSAVILYADPADVNQEFNGKNDEKTHPDSWWMPSVGIQRGTAYTQRGDPKTPGYPSTDYAYHLDKSNMLLPKIPCQPISYGDALHILGNLSGPISPASWHGTLPIEYRIGPGYDNATDIEVKVTVNNYLDNRPLYNVIGTIQGSEEPDRYVLLGSHHDSWVYGAVDAHSSSTALTQVAELFGQLLKRGYRPRRTLVFCSWDASEPGLIGSTEWVEDNLKNIFERAVAYLNVDMIVQGNFTLDVSSSPLLQDVLYTTAKQIPSPKKEYKTLYDLWQANSMSNINDREPRVTYSLGAGSDQAIFYQLAGVSSANFGFTFDPKKYPMTTYPLYHSSFDNFYTFEHYLDPEFKYTQSMTQFWAVLANNLADAKILPLKVTRYSTAVKKFIYDLIRVYEEIWKKHNVHTDPLLSSVQNFTEATLLFENRLSSEKDLEKKPYRMRMYNDQMMKLERAFLNFDSLSERPYSKHIVFAPSASDLNTDSFFPGLTETMYDIEEELDKWNQLKEQMSITTYFLQSAAKTLSENGML